MHLYQLSVPICLLYGAALVSSPNWPLTLRNDYCIPILFILAMLSKGITACMHASRENLSLEMPEVHAPVLQTLSA